MQLRSGNRQLIREINKSLVLSIVRNHAPISRTDISQMANLSLAAVSDITGELISQGLIYEQEAGTSTGGRPPILLALNHRAGYVLGIKLTEKHVVAAMTDLGAEIVDQQSAPLGDDAGRRPETVVQVLAETVERLRAIHPDRRIFGVGIGMAGVMDRRNGVCRFSPFFQWRDVPLGRMLEQRLGLPVVLENDANTLALAEKWFGAGLGASDFLVITLGRGIGMGMVLNGQLYRGGRGGAGEFGHIVMVPDGPQCDCGKRGCLEALVSDPAILRRIRTALGRELTMEEAISLARHGDATAQGIFAAAGRTLGMAIADLVNIFNPTLIVIGGEGARAFDLMTGPLQETLKANSFDGFFDDLRLVVEPWGDDAWARGAAGLMLEEMFRPTLYRDEESRASLVLPASANPAHTAG
jgi:predicted NBD/HSP70 family sugar kinase